MGMRVRVMMPGRGRRREMEIGPGHKRRHHRQGGRVHNDPPTQQLVLLRLVTVTLAWRWRALQVRRQTALTTTMMTTMPMEMMVMVMVMMMVMVVGMEAVVMTCSMTYLR